MPTALLRACSHDGCPELVESGACPGHQRQVEQRRGSAASRGYGRAWQTFRQLFIGMLIAAGIAPVCGARLFGGPSPHSRCAAAGRLVQVRLHLDHDPPLTDAERQVESAVCDPKRVGFLCETCHNAKTQAEQRRGAAA